MGGEIGTHIARYNIQVSLISRKTGAFWHKSSASVADISVVLAKDKISIFALSTFDTDYILVKSEKLHVAMLALQRSGYKFKN